MKGFLRTLSAIFITMIFLCAGSFAQESKDDAGSGKAKEEEQPGTVVKYKTKLISTIDKGKLPQRILYEKDGAWMALIPAGEFTMGTENWKDQNGNKDESPSHQVYLESYYIDQYEVTNRQYLTFCRQTKHTLPTSLRDDNYKDPEQPVVGITYDDAAAYAKWCEKRLPTEAEWEKAARGTDGRIYPWGDEWDTNACNNKELKMRKTSKVGAFEKDKSPYDVYDMAGNASEWVFDSYDPKYYEKSPKENPKSDKGDNIRVIRGGNYYYQTRDCRTTNRQAFPQNQFRSEYGFRCVKDMAPVPVPKKQLINRKNLADELEKNILTTEPELIECFKSGKNVPDKFLPEKEQETDSTSRVATRQDVMFYNLTDTNITYSMIDKDGKIVVLNKMIPGNGGKWSYVKYDTIYLIYYKFSDKPDEIKRGGFMFVESGKKPHVVFDLELKYSRIGQAPKKTAPHTEADLPPTLFKLYYGQYRPPYNVVSVVNRASASVRIKFKSEESLMLSSETLLETNTFMEKEISNGSFYLLSSYEKLQKPVFKSKSFLVTSDKNKFLIPLYENKKETKTFSIEGKTVYPIEAVISQFTDINMNEF